MTWSKIEELKRELRDNDDQANLKHGVDYAVACKYGEVHVCCHALYRENIETTAEKLGLKITSIATWGAEL